MENYSTFDYLCNDPFYIKGIGNIRCPTLRDIRNMTYNAFNTYANVLSISVDDFLKLYGMNHLTNDEEEQITMFDILKFKSPHLLIGFIDTFITDQWKYDEIADQFIIYHLSNNEEDKILGHIGNDNFETFRNSITCILGLGEQTEEPPKYKNDTAKKLYEKMKNHKPLKKAQDKNYTIDNMIKKYCTHNKVGINILNVWDMTYYQFISMFSEYCNGRQCDINDMIAANSFNYKSSADYKPQEYMNKLKNN